MGALVGFTGLVRDHPLLIEHYPGMAERAIRRVLDEVCTRRALLGAIVIHRFGQLAVGEPIVLVMTAARHRAHAFAAAWQLMDYLKTEAPFWKKAPTGWVEARAADERARAAWTAR